MPQKRTYICAFEAGGMSSLNIEVLGAQSILQSTPEGSSPPARSMSSCSPYASATGRFGSPCVLLRPRFPKPTASHNCLQETLDWTRLDCQDFLRIAKDVSVEDLFECIITDKMYSKTGERTWDLNEFILQRKDRRMFIGGQGVVLFVRRQGHSTSLAMKVCYHRRDERKVERHVQRTILHLKAQNVSQFVGKILVNYLTRRFFITIMPKAKFASLKSLKQELGFLSEASIRYFFACITSALAKLHAIQVCHRDIKCDNVLIMHSGAPALIDFGLAVKGGQSMEDYKQNSRMTQMQYYPPETRQTGNVINDYKIDSWLLGFFLCEMLLAEREHLWTKFKTSNQKDWTFATCSSCKIPASSTVIPVLLKLLNKDPKERIHVADVQYLPYLQEGGYYNNIETMEPPALSNDGSIKSEKDLSE